eukprot:CAMPEP_0171025128 /NCGR_PEP_ID=MMETSP0736-20130129/33405_1 /TAXON_ID=186038 /ORGANISM="Fragilariopsis kerguelensis, Strain L26-C5" /LENGTH=49 /DNA_ID=CAMNT_0011465219 /DNA_START=57 /DNA_END=206 /DNA_ORIENTATION=-
MNRFLHDTCLLIYTLFHKALPTFPVPLIGARFSSEGAVGTWAKADPPPV